MAGPYSRYMFNYERVFRSNCIFILISSVWEFWFPRMFLVPTFGVASFKSVNNSNGYTVAVSALLFSLVTKDVEHLFRYLLTVQRTFAKSLLRSFPIKKTGCYSYCWVAIATYIFWIQDPWQMYFFFFFSKQNLITLLNGI